MANNESIPTNPSGHEMSAHVSGYDHFLTLFKWGAILSFIVGFIVVVFVLG